MNTALSGPDYRTAAMILVAAAALPGTRNPERMLLCAIWLLERADKAEEYMKNVRIAFPFLVEADHLVALICTEREAPLEDLGGTTFSLLECGAVVTKESTLGKDTQRMRPAQVAVMRFFEGSGLWGPGDGTLVSEYYFNRLSY